jgi:hypothetical protein
MRMKWYDHLGFALGMVMVAAIVGGLLGAAGFGAVNLVADSLHLPGGQGPWPVVLWAGARIGLVSGPLGAMFGVIVGRMIVH